MLENIQSIKPI